MVSISLYLLWLSMISTIDQSTYLKMINKYSIYFEMLGKRSFFLKA